MLLSPPGNLRPVPLPGHSSGLLQGRDGYRHRSTGFKKQVSIITASVLKRWAMNGVQATMERGAVIEKGSTTEMDATTVMGTTTEMERYGRV